MISSLFSGFDPCCLTTCLIPGYCLILWAFLLSTSCYIAVSLTQTLLNYPLDVFITNLSFSNSSNSVIASSMLTLLFSILLFLNISGLQMYVFTASSQISFALSFALPLWFSSILLSVASSLSSFCAHLVPLGCPVALSPFIVLVESVSLVIRPLTLAVRLMANIVAGHLLLSLLVGPLPCGLASSLISLALFLILGLELAVALIQAYVIVTLCSLYLQEA